MIEFLKIRNVKNPKRDYGDAGIDVFIPEKEESFVQDLLVKNPELEIDETIVIHPGQNVLIPLGIKSKFPADLALEAANKSGICTKTSLIVGAQVIDSNYQGEWHGHLLNVGQKPVELLFGQKIIQFVPRFIYSDDFTVVDDKTEDEFYPDKTKRGEGGFGSTSIVE